MGWIEPMVFLSGVFMGTGSTITIKIIYGLESIGLSGGVQKFEKPLFTTWVMFVAMMIALPIHFVQQWFKKSSKGDYQRIIKHPNNEPDEKEVQWSTYFLLVIPACFDLAGTALAQVGLLFCTVSVYQLLRCTVIIVTALLKATVLRHKLSSYMWFGILINFLAMSLVACTSFFPGASVEVDAEGNNRDPRIGILFVLLSCLVQGSQYVFEEKVMTIDNAPPLVVVGMEGLWGTILMPLIVFPWAYVLPGSDVGGCVENFYDAYVQMCNSTSVQIVLLIFTVTVCLYNIFCIYVTYLLNSIWHAILDNFRPVSVWSTDLLLYYVFTRGAFGESWTMYSWIEFAGMILLFIGTAVYNGTLVVPGFDYSSGGEGDDIEDTELDGDDEEIGSLTPSRLTPTIRTASKLSSPSLTRSPLINQSIKSARDRSNSNEFGNNSHNQSHGKTGYGAVTTGHNQSSRSRQAQQIQNNKR